MIGVKPLNSKKDGTCQELLGNYQHTNFKPLFLMGKEIDVEFNHDWEKLCRVRVKTTLQGLLPVFGKIMPGDKREFVDVLKY